MKAMDEVIKKNTDTIYEEFLFKAMLLLLKEKDPSCYLKAHQDDFVAFNMIHKTLSNNHELKFFLNSEYMEIYSRRCEIKNMKNMYIRDSKCLSYSICIYLLNECQYFDYDITCDIKSKLNENEYFNLKLKDLEYIHNYNEIIKKRMLKKGCKKRKLLKKKCRTN